MVRSIIYLLFFMLFLLFLTSFSGTLLCLAFFFFQSFVLTLIRFAYHYIYVFTWREMGKVREGEIVIRDGKGERREGENEMGDGRGEGRGKCDRRKVR